VAISFDILLNESHCYGGGREEGERLLIYLVALGDLDDEEDCEGE
jgi:hypothetical protein